MATRILGLDIHKQQLLAVVVEQQRGAERIIRACAARDVDDLEQIPAALSEILEQDRFQADSCVLGLPLSIISLRNLTLPFTDRRKMEQVLPLELEEQLLRPVDEQVVDFMVTGRRGASSHLLIGTVEKQQLQVLLSALQEHGLKPQLVTPAISSLAGEYLGESRTEAVLFLHACTHAMDMALWSGDRVLFMRRIVYPEQFFLESVSGQQREQPVFNQQTAEKYIPLICNVISSGLYYFQQEREEKIEVRTAVLSGCIAGQNSWRELMTAGLGLEVEVSPPLHEQPGIRSAEAVPDDRQPYLFDTALALALGGVAKKKPRALNFLRGEFAQDSWLFFSKRSLLAAAVAFSLVCVAGIGFLWTDYRGLHSRASALREEMVQLFKQTFPDVTRVVDPYVQMQSKLREVRSSEVSIPLFSGDRRVLEILADISGRIPADLSLHVSRLVIDQETVQIKGTTDAYNNVDVIKNKLATSVRYADVKIVSATADKKKGAIRFEIRLQLAEAS